ncbi:FAD-dependent oxidoreductase, partial [Aeromonas schubertii]|uniref:FAD-dependent oxidoreductase n=1 Tax=Aeromonas schubertii TaxID=652 RepID=UPI0038B4A560
PGLMSPHSEARALPPTGHIPEEAIDILIVGAGPAGIAAATVASNAGASVTVLDERSRPGGQYYKQPARVERIPMD